MGNTVVGFQQIAEFLESISTGHVDGSLYRGHGSRAWEVKPSSFRKGVYGIRDAHDLARWKEAARRFVDRPTSDLEWLVLAQHYGIPTALLDWTTNPLVALYFACQPAKDLLGNDTPGSIVSMTRHSLTKDSRTDKLDVFAKWSGPPLLVSSETMNKRSLAQDSVMTLHCEGNHELTPGYDPIIYTIQHYIKTPILDALRVMGISSDRIYADINTAAREFNDGLIQAAAVRAFAANMQPSLLQDDSVPGF